MTAAYGWKPAKPDHRDWRLGEPHAPAALPEKVDLRSSGFMPGVYDQGQLGSCTANAIAGAYEFELKRQGEDFMPSRLYIYYKERELEGTVDQDAGAEIRDGLKVVGNGVPPESDWTYDIGTFTGPPPAKAVADATLSHAVSYYSLNAGPGAPFRACLAAGFPFVFGFNVPERFEALTSKDPYLPLPGRKTRFVGGHAVLAVGYDWSCRSFPAPVWIVRNSWGAGWGEQGYCYMHYEVLGKLASDFWTIRTVS